VEADYRALAELRYQIRRFLHFSEERARAAGVEPQQHQLLLAIKGLPEGCRPTIRHIADRLFLAHHSTVELVSRLVDKGLLTRARSDDDRREVLVQLTARGERVLRSLARAHEQELQNAGPELIRSLQPLLRTARAADKTGGHSKVRAEMA